MGSQTKVSSGTIKLVAVMEPAFVTGAARNMLDFCRDARDLRDRFPELPAIETSIVTFARKPISSLNHPYEANVPPKGKPSNDFVKAARELGLEVDIIKERRRFDLRAVSALREIVERRAPDIVVTYHVKSHFLMKLSRLWLRIPWVAFHHGYTRTYLRERFYNRLDRLSLPRATRVLTVCHAFARELEEAGVRPDRISVQHNSIRHEQPPSAEEAQELRSRLGVSQMERMVLAIGRLSREKAHIDLISAVSQLRDAYPEINARLVIVGDGPEMEPLRAAADGLGVTERIIFAGQIQNVKPYYAAADLFVLPSHSEGSPYVLLESMSASLPIVATAVGGVPEMVEDEESALLVPPGDPRAMAAAIARMLRDAQLARKLSANALRLITSRYSPETYVRSLIKIYLGIIPSAARPDLHAL